MAANSSFTLNGANPLSGAPRSTVSPFTAAGTPAASALNYAQSTPAIKPVSLHTTPTTPVKKVTLNADGSQTAEYHAPAKTSGMINSTPKSAPAAAPAAPAAAPTPTPNPAYQTGGNPNAAPSLVGTNQSQSGGLNSNGNYPTIDNTGNYNVPTPTPTTATPDNSYSGLINQGTTALNQAGQAGQSAAQLKQAMARETQDVMGNPYYSGSIKVGNANLIQQNQGSQLTGLAEEQQALSTQGQGYINAANLVPEALRYGSGAGALNPLNNVSSIAQQVLSGQISPATAKTMGGNLSNFGGLLNAELQKQSGGKYNEASAQAGYDAKQHNITAAGTAGTDANVSGYGPALQNYNDINLKLNNVSDLGNLAVNTGQLGGINPFDAKYANMSVAEFRNQLSSEAQKRFDSSLAAFGSSASSLIAATTGGTPTDVTGIKNGLVDQGSTMKVLSGLVDQAKKEGAIQAGNRASQVLDYKAGINGQQPQHLPGTMTTGGLTYVLGTDGTYNPLK